MPYQIDNKPDRTMPIKHTIERLDCSNNNLKCDTSMDIMLKHFQHLVTLVPE